MPLANLRPAKNRTVFAWQMYDWANSAFATVIIAAVLPQYFRVVYGMRFPGGESSDATAMWGGANALSMTLVALVALLLGPLADRLARKKPSLGAFVALGVAATAVLGFIPLHLWWLIALMYALANVGFAGGNIFYDALLPGVAPPGKLDKVSAGGYALGYVGGGLLLAGCVGLILAMPKQSVTLTGGQAMQVPVAAMQISFVLVALWWAGFSLPLFRKVPEPPELAPEGPADLASMSLKRVGTTIKELLHHRQLLIFLIAFWLYSDGFGTIIKMAGIYGGEIFSAQGKDPTTHLILTLLLVQFAGVPFTLLWARIAGRIGAKQSVLICLGIYAGICVLGYYMTQLWHFYALGFGVALVQGGTQALSRSLFACLVPKGREAQFFGFYNISGKFAGIIGPLLFALMVEAGRTSRETILALVVFFIAGAALLATVKIPRQRPEDIPGES